MDKADKLFLLILLTALVVRFYNFDYPISDSEVHTQYLQARHVAIFGDRPLVGYFNGTFPALGSSPLNYYLLAGLISVKDNLMFPGIVNLLVQISAVGMLYFMAKGMFGKKVAIISSFFLSFSYIHINYSLKIWIPHVAYFFITLSYFLMYLYYRKRKTWFITTSCISLAVATAMHLSVFAIVPLYFYIGYLIGKKLLILVSVYFATLSLFFAPLVGYHLQNKLPAGGKLIASIAFSPGDFLPNLITKTKTFIDIFFPFTSWYGPVALVALILLAFNYFVKIRPKTKIFTIILLAPTALTILVASLINQPLMSQHFVAVTGLFPLALAEIIARPISKKYFVRLGQSILFLLLLYSLSGGLFYFKPKPWLQNQQTAKFLNNAVAKSYLPFQTRFALITSPSVPKQPDDIWFFDSLFWINLERTLNMKLVNVFYPIEYDVNPSSYFAPIGSDDFVILGCQSFSDSKKDCLLPYLTDHRRFRFKEKLFEDFRGYSFYLLARQFP